MAFESEELQQVIAQTKARRAGKGYLGRCPCHDDKTASLSIAAGDKQAVVVNCQAGCDFKDVRNALGLTKPPSNSPRAEPLKYDYTDADGRLLYQVLRYPPKEFRQQRPDGKGGWIRDLDGVQRVPYALPDLIEAIALGKRVFVPEGEKDCESLRSVGLIATTNSGGAAWKWTPAFSGYFRGARVVVLPDNDSPGRVHAKQVSEALNGIAESVRVLPLPGLPEKGDVTDWLLQGGTASALQGLAEAADTPEGSTSTDPERKHRFTLYDDVEIQNLPQPGWLIGGVLPSNGLAALVGAPKSYKSFVALDWACHVALGLAWHGRDVRQGAVIYIYAEGATGISQRVMAWKRYARLDSRLGVLFLPRRVTINADNEAAELLAWIQERVVPPPALIIVDTLNRNLSGNENSSEDMGAFVRGCDHLRDGTGATVLVVHHKGHGADDRGRGSSVFEAAADTVLLCTRDESRVTIECKWMKDAPEFPDLALEALEIAPSLVLKPSGVNDGGLKGQRLALLTSLHDNYTEDGASYNPWKEATGLASSSFNKARSWLQSQAYVKSESGKWKITDAGRMALSTYSTVTPLRQSGAGVIHSTTQGGYVIPPAVELDGGVGQTDLLPHDKDRKGIAA